MVEVKVPSPGESITQVQLATWLVSDGAYVNKDDEIAEIDSDKATLSISAPQSGSIKLLAREGDTLEVDAKVAQIDTSAKPPSDQDENHKAPAGTRGQPEQSRDGKSGADKGAKGGPKESTTKSPTQEVSQNRARDDLGEGMPGSRETKEEKPGINIRVTPLAQQILREMGIDHKDLGEAIKGLRVGRRELEKAVDKLESQPEKESPGAMEDAQRGWGKERNTRQVKMSALRQKVSSRLVSVKNETAMLTTFNEVNMAPVMELRYRHKDAFREKYGVKPGFMSFFSMAAARALQEIPEVNARLEDDQIIYHEYADLGIAVSTPRGLMVPVVRDVHTMNLGQTELAIQEMAEKARSKKLSLDEMQGGTFTITNGGVFGSMLSTPIINPPQSAILGMHNIQERPVAINGQVVIKPMMYLALSYDHRIIDGREAVVFLVKIKELLENPVQMLFHGKDPERLLMGL